MSSRIDALKLSRCLLFCVCKRVTKMVVCAKKKVIKKFVLRARERVSEKERRRERERENERERARARARELDR